MFAPGVRVVIPPSTFVFGFPAITGADCRAVILNATPGLSLPSTRTVIVALVPVINVEASALFMTLSELGDGAHVFPLSIESAMNIRAIPSPCGIKLILQSRLRRCCNMPLPSYHELSLLQTLSTVTESTWRIWADTVPAQKIAMKQANLINSVIEFFMVICPAR
jgi:hypothetical protein